MKTFFLIAALTFSIQLIAYPTHQEKLAYYRKKMHEMHQQERRAYSPIHPRKGEIKLFSRSFYQS